MYKYVPLPASILIIKTSSLGDIIQSFNVLDHLHQKFPHVAIDWAVEAQFVSIVAAHPLIRRAIPLHIKKVGSFFNDLRNLRKEKYDLVFDLQGNCKSGFITFFSRGKTKVGFGFHSVREWPNLLATHLRFEVSKNQNIRLYYLGLIQQYFKDASLPTLGGVRLKIEEKEEERVNKLLIQTSGRQKVMVCPGSKWINKQLPLETLIAFLQKIENSSFLLAWGTESERIFCQQIQKRLASSFIIDKLPLPTWQNLMSEMDLVIAVDSSALHLCATTTTHSFSIFGPTSADIFKPIGSHHFAFQGTCPYGRTFEKACPILRTCSTGACIRNITAETLFESYKKSFE